MKLMFSVGRPIGAALAATLFLAHVAPVVAAPAPYEGRLVRLAEILGSLHYLRPLCGEAGDKWRREMEGLLDAEKPDNEQRAQLIASFNRGYRSFSETYTACTPSAIAAIDRYMDEGEKLTRDTAARFGN